MKKNSQFHRRRQGAKARRGLSSGTTQTRRAWWVGSRSQSPSRRGRHHYLPRSQTYLYWSPVCIFCFWRISLGLHNYLSIVTFIFVKSQNSYFLCVIHDIFQTSLCNAASIVYIVSCKMSSFRCSLISILFKGTCDKYRLCVFGQVTSLQDRFLMLFSIKGWEVGIFWSGGKVLVIHFRKYMTSYGLRTLCNDPETLTKWKVSVTKSFSHISSYFSHISWI